MPGDNCLMNANESSNQYVSMTAQYIIENQIISDTTTSMSVPLTDSRIYFTNKVWTDKTGGLKWYVVSAMEKSYSTAPAPAPAPAAGETVYYSCIDEDDIGQKTLDIASATLAFSVITVVGFIAYSYYASVVPTTQVIGKDGKWGEASNPMSIDRSNEAK